MIKKNQILAPHTTFNIGGPADWFCEAEEEEEVLKAIKFAQEKNLPYFILGQGSNILVSDKGVRGMVIKMKNEKLKIKNCKIRGGAGLSLNKLLNIAKENSLSGLEFMAGIPGSLGGAVVGNAGAWQQNMGDKVERVKVLNEKGQFKWLNQVDCRFAYRQSRFKNSREVVLEVEINLNKDNKEKIKKEMVTNLKKRSHQPQEPSAGSVFINPKPQAAADLIEKCGLKGKKIGQAQISEKHANFIVNLGKAKAQDVLSLINLARETVKKKFDLDLALEINLIGEFDD